jgi:MYXO-CTERM domain-containing protein
MARLLLASLLFLLLATPAAWGESPDAAAAGAKAWRGRYCTPTRCGPPPQASASGVAGFGAAAFGAIRLARRRRPQ